MRFRQQYTDPANDARLGRLVAVSFDPEGDRAVQAYKDECDINQIVRRFGVTGELPVTRLEPLYGDFSAVPDYQTALNMVREAGAAFDSLPSAVRRRFGNDPAELMQFLQDPSNREEAERLGLVVKPALVEPVILEGDSAGE